MATRQEIEAAWKLICMVFDDAKMTFTKKDHDWEVRSTFTMDPALAYSIFTYVTVGKRSSEGPGLFDEIEEELRR